ncbi:MAG: hypothetical protein IPL59_26505 [Candidatus Competibacteraceae bacterium]|nr:hypothetical protein [Candidatus Competibacteraceae bacterium]
MIGMQGKQAKPAPVIAVSHGSKPLANIVLPIVIYTISSYLPDFDKVSLFIMKLFGFLNQDYYLTLDRTNWKWGKKH